MAEEPEEAAAPEATEVAEGGGKKRSKLILIIAGAVLLLVVAGGAAFFLLGSGDAESTSSNSSETASSAAGEGEAGDAAEGGGESLNNLGLIDEDTATFVDINFGATYTLKPFHSNLGNPLENRYLRLELAFEYKQGDEQRNEIEARLPQLRDAILSIVSLKTREFLLGPDGKDQLRLELLNRVNQYMEKKIESVFITDLLIE